MLPSSGDITSCTRSASFLEQENGRALIESEIDKGLFTGGVENGRRVLASSAGRPTWSPMRYAPRRSRCSTTAST